MEDRKKQKGGRDWERTIKERERDKLKKKAKTREGWNNNTKKFYNFFSYRSITIIFLAGHCMTSTVETASEYSKNQQEMLTLTTPCSCVTHMFLHHVKNYRQSQSENY